MNPKREPIRSSKYLRGSKDQRCTFNISHICTHGPTVACHIRDETHGRGIKADDTSTADGCQACHDLFDGRTGTLSREDWSFYGLRALQRTMRRRVKQGLLILALDRPAIRKIKPRKPKEQRAKIASRSLGYQPGNSKDIYEDIQ